MTMDVLLGIGVGTALICCLGLWIMPDFYERLHYMATVTTVSSFCIFMAVVVKEGWGQATIKMGLIFLIMLITNAILTHATARAARVRTYGFWSATPEDEIRIEEGVGEKLSNEARRRNEC